MSMEFLAEEEAAQTFEAPKREYKGGPTGPRPRSVEQSQWDEAMKRAHDGNGVMAVQVKPDAAGDAKKRIDSACRFLGLSATAGVPKPGKVEGTVILTWKIRVPKPRKKRSEAAETPQETSAE